MPRAKKPDDEKAIKCAVSFTPEQFRLIEKYCQVNERSISWVVRKALEDWLPIHADDKTI